MTQPNTLVSNLEEVLKSGWNSESTFVDCQFPSTLDGIQLIKLAAVETASLQKIVVTVFWDKSAYVTLSKCMFFLLAIPFC